MRRHLHRRKKRVSFFIQNNNIDQWFYDRRREEKFLSLSLSRTMEKITNDVWNFSLRCKTKKESIRLFLSHAIRLIFVSFFRLKTMIFLNMRSFAHACNAFSLSLSLRHRHLFERSVRAIKAKQEKEWRCFSRFHFSDIESLDEHK